MQLFVQVYHSNSNRVKYSTLNLQNLKNQNKKYIFLLNEIFNGVVGINFFYQATLKIGFFFRLTPSWKMEKYQIYYGHFQLVYLKKQLVSFAKNCNLKYFKSKK